MTAKYNTVVIGGGCLGCACAFSIQRKLGKKAGKVAVLEKKVLGAGLSSRHSAIVRSANASPMAARMAKLATQYWKHLKPIWGIDIPFEQPGALWIAGNQDDSDAKKWQGLEAVMQQESVPFSMISRQQLAELSQDSVKTSSEEIYYYEPEVLQLDSAQILKAMQTAAKINKIELIEHCQVYDFECDSQGGITLLHTSQGKLAAENIINAAGGWSSELFAGIGIRIPVALEPVYVANFLVGAQDLPETMPIIADFVNRAYFRRWRGSILHMHQPRSRAGKDIAHSFSRAAMNPDGANVIYDASNFNVNHQQVNGYLVKVQNRFTKIDKPVYAGGYQSFFDITPDLKFILGPDPQAKNLFHCLGAGQSLKYAPIFGEIIAQMVMGEDVLDGSISIEEFSIGRFADKPISDFWQVEQTKAHTL